MSSRFYPLLLLCFLFLKVVTATEEEKKRDVADSRQLEYISLINTLLKQTNVLSSVDGALLALATILASLVTRFKPFLLASALSYLIYVATAIMLPGPLSEFGLPTMEAAERKMSARSMETNVNTNKIFDNVMAETLIRSIQLSPVMTIVTNVSVNVITDTMARVRIMSRSMVQQLSLLQGNMLWFSRMLSNDCVSKFLCRVGQFTERNFPIASSFLRTLANSYPGMDDFAVAVVRGTSSSNCSLIYPDCTL